VRAPARAVAGRSPPGAVRGPAGAAARRGGAEEASAGHSAIRSTSGRGGGKIAQGDLIAVPVPVPAGIAKAEFRLEWREDWGNYPASDIDLLLVDPGGAMNTDGATLDNPEVVAIKNPAPGTWVALLSGFEIHTRFDRYELRVSLDGNVVKVK
jgi:hypothetical protein